MKIITWAKIKGGVGNTTLALLLGQYLASKGKKVLFADTDHQCNLTHYYDVFQDKNTIANVFLREGAVDILNVAENIDLIPGSMRLDEAERLLETDPNKNMVLYDWLADNYEKRGLDQYDYMILDCRPDFGIATKNAIAISHVLFSPVMPGEFSFESKANLELRMENYRKTEIVRPSRESLITAELYFVLNMVAHNTNSSRELIEALKDDQDVIGQFDKKELFNRTNRDHTLIDMWQNPAIYSRHRSFFSDLEKTLNVLIDKVDKS